MRRNFGSSSPLFSRYTSCKGECVSGEQQGVCIRRMWRLWSHVEMSGFLTSDVTTCSKPSQFFTTASTCDNTTPRQVSWFSDFVCILYNLKSHFRQVPRHVTSTRCSRFHVSSWIRPKHTLNIMSINFWMTKVHYSMYLQFKFEISRKIRRNEIN